MSRVLKSAFTILLLLVMVSSFAVPAMAAQEPVVADGAIVAEGNPIPYGEISFEYVAPAYASDGVVYHDTVEAAAAELRSAMEQRQTSVVIGIRADDDFQNKVKAVVDGAFAHTGVPTQGDYLYRQFRKWSAKGAPVVYNPSLQTYEIAIPFEIEYYTNAAQEKVVDAAVKQLLDDLNVYQASNYEKVCAIYDYMCDNITYDFANLEDESYYLKYTAYAALIDKTSVCQGYANLFYRLALELGVDARIIGGIGNGGGHAWNIVRLNGRYYNLDSTWDAGTANHNYSYFLRCTANFGDHHRDAEFSSAEFNAAYPMSDTDYDGSVADPADLAGEIDGKTGLTDGDAVYLLRHILFPSVFFVDPGIDLDFDGDGIVLDTDAVYLLRHVLFPQAFPLYPNK